MQLSLWIALGAIGINLSAVDLMHLFQVWNKNLPRQDSLIPGTEQKFLYNRDYYTMTYGNLIAVSLIDVAFAHLVARSHIPVWQWVVFAIIGAACAIFFRWLKTLPDNKVDANFPGPREISPSGRVFLVYFGSQVAVTGIAMWNLFADNLWGQPVMMAGLLGVIGFAVCFVADIKSGNFDPKRPLRS